MVRPGLKIAVPNAGSRLAWAWKPMSPPSAADAVSALSDLAMSANLDGSLSRAWYVASAWALAASQAGSPDGGGDADRVLAARRVQDVAHVDLVREDR